MDHTFPLGGGKGRGGMFYKPLAQAFDYLESMNEKYKLCSYPMTPRWGVLFRWRWR